MSNKQNRTGPFLFTCTAPITGTSPLGRLHKRLTAAKTDDARLRKLQSRLGSQTAISKQPNGDPPRVMPNQPIPDFNF